MYDLVFNAVTATIASGALITAIWAAWKADQTSNKANELSDKANQTSTMANELRKSTDDRIGQLIAEQKAERERIAEGRRKQWAIKSTDSQHVWVLTNIGHPTYGVKIEAEYPAELELTPDTGDSIDTDEEVTLWLTTTDPEQFPSDRQYDPEIEECGVESRYVTITWHRLPDLSDRSRQVHYWLPFDGH